MDMDMGVLTNINHINHINHINVRCRELDSSSTLPHGTTTSSSSSNNNSIRTRRASGRAPMASGR